MSITVEVDTEGRLVIDGHGSRVALPDCGLEMRWAPILTGFVFEAAVDDDVIPEPIGVVEGMVYTPRPLVLVSE